MQRHDLFAVTAANREAWDSSAALHAAGPAWAELVSAAAKSGFSVLDACLTETLSGIGVRGRRAVQIGCNNARELLSLASLGAEPALGIDQSKEFLAQAALLSEASGLRPRLLQSDIYALPEGLGTYDLALITIGVLNWMPDLPRFFGVVAGLLAPGGALVIYETHPILEMFDPAAEDPFLPAFDYFAEAPKELTRAITYDGTDDGPWPSSFWFGHTMGEIVTSCIQAGLRLERLTEHRHSNREVEYDIYRDRKAPAADELHARRLAIAPTAAP